MTEAAQPAIAGADIAVPEIAAAEQTSLIPETVTQTEAAAPPDEMSRVLVVLTNLPDLDSAKTIARLLIEQRLAACVNILPSCHSVYSWDSVLEESTEIPMLIKTTRDRYATLEHIILEHHPYELPEIIALPVERGLPGFLDWVTVQTL